MPVVSGNDSKGKYYKVENVDTKYYVSEFGEDEAKKKAKIQEFAIYNENNRYYNYEDYYEIYDGENDDSEVEFYLNLMSEQDCEFYSSKEFNKVDLTPSVEMASNSQLALNIRKERECGSKGGTVIDIARAKQIIGMQKLSPDAVKDMLYYFLRNEYKKDNNGWNDQNKCWQAWNLLGGDEGYLWSKRKVAQLFIEEEKEFCPSSESVVINTANGYIELNDEVETNQARAGRTRIKIVAHEIYDSEDIFNKNGISWQEPYVSNNIDSAIGMPYVVQFLDDYKTIPVGHGNMEFDDEGMVIFEDSETVGTVQNVYTGKVIISGVEKNAMITEGYLYNQRYPNFVKWLKEQAFNGDKIKGSIEINGKGESKIIEYANGKNDINGNLKMGRIPSVFDYSGMAILFLEDPSDDTAEMLEINKKMKGDNFMDFEKLYKEEVEKNAKLESDISANSASKLELEDAVVNANKEIESLKAEKVVVETELNSLKVEKETVDTELNSYKEKESKEEVKKYFDEEVSKNGFEESEINELKVFVEKVDLDGLKSKESEFCVKKVKAQAELNSKNKNDKEDLEKNSIMFNTDSEEDSDKLKFNMTNIK